MVSGLKQAFVQGAQDALSHYGLAPKREKSTLRKALPWLAAAGAGVGAYKYLRTPSFSANPALRKIQELASRKGFHRVVDVTADGTGGLLRPVANAEGKLSPLNKLKLFLNEGTTEAIPALRTDTSAKLVGNEAKNVSGVVHGRHGFTGVADKIHGGVDLEGDVKTQQLMNHLSRGGKRREADLLQKHAPGSIPETHTDLSQLFDGLPADRYDAMHELRSRVISNHGDNLILKPNQGLASGGKFPQTSHDWADQLRAYDTHMADPANRKAFRAMRAEGGNEVSGYLTNNGIYEGSVLDRALKKPKSIIAQKRIDNPQGEYRVHTMAGSAPSNMVIPRFAKTPKDKLKAVPRMLGGHDDMRKFVEDTVSKLPPQYQGGNYAFDVMPHTLPDGKQSYKILEMNPTEMATEHAAGGGSGFLDTSATPLTGNLHYRAATGRHTPLVAGLGASAAAGAAGLGARALLNHDDDER